jgi:hypothetical protein
MSTFLCIDLEVQLHGKENDSDKESRSWSTDLQIGRWLWIAQVA